MARLGTIRICPDLAQLLVVMAPYDLLLVSAWNARRFETSNGARPTLDETASG